MSLQRIFESARKLGTPVIVTDITGREPMVVLPLEQFEAMTDHGVDDIGDLVDLDEVHVSKPSQTPSAVSASSEETIDELEGLIKQEAKHQEISLDERFYLEPVDEETGRP